LGPQGDAEAETTLRDRPPASRLPLDCQGMPSRRWNREDFETIARSYEASDEELAARFPKRPSKDVRFLRAILHEYHESGRRHVPDDSMAARLVRMTGQLVCAICRQPY
jgi:hypothetical protein